MICDSKTVLKFKLGLNFCLWYGLTSSEVLKSKALKLKSRGA